MKKNNHLNAFMGMILLLVMVLLPSISAYEFDNVKSYNAETREVTIINALGLGAEIGKAKLNTPLNVMVGAGYQKVAEFDLWAYQDYNDALKQFSFTDMKTKGKINRNYDLKFLSYENVSVDDYENQITGTIMNGTNLTNVYSNVKVGSHIEVREKWTKITPADLKKNDVLTIGVFTDVQIGDYVDWVPMIYGVEVEEWATWTADLNVGLVSYWNFDGDLNDALGRNNLTNSGYTFTTGKLGSAVNSSNAEHDYAYKTSFSGLVTGAGARSACAWVMKYTDVAGRYFGYGADTTNQMWTAGFGDGGATNKDQPFVNHYFNDNLGTTHAQNNTWYLLCVAYDGTTERLYLNGVNEGNVTYTLNTGGTTFYAGSYLNLGNWIDGRMDELGYWNRSLTQAEVIQLYNNGTGITYPIITITPPTITINTASQNLTEVQTTTINFTVFDEVKVQNVSLYVNGVLNQTNTSGINNTNYLFNVTLSDGTYTILGNAWNNQTTNNVANSSAITIIVESTHPIITGNLSNTTLYVLGGNLTLNYNVTHNPNLTGVTAWYSYNGTNRTLNTSLNAINFTTATGQYDLVLYANDSFNNQATPVSLSFVLDSQTPQITLNYPTSLLNYGAINGTLQLNLSASDVNLDKVWYDYNGTNVTVTGAVSGVNNLSNITLSTKKNVTIYANDTAGNTNFTTYSWDYKVFENNRSFTTPIVETTLDTFTINVTANTSLTAVYLNWNGTEYAASGSAGVYTKQLYIPPVTSSSTIPVYWRFDYGGTNITSTTTNQVVNKLIFQLCNATIDKLLVNFTTKSAENPFPLVNTSFKSNWMLSVSAGATPTTYNYEDLVIDGSSYAFCTNTNTTTYYVSSEIEYAGTGYATNFYYLTDAELIATTPQNITLYLLNDSIATTTVLRVEDTAQKPFEDYTVQIQSYDVGTGTFYTVGMAKTDYKGEDVVYLNWYDTLYKFIVSDADGNVVKTTGTTKITGTPTIIEITTDITFVYDKFENFVYNLYYDNATNNFVLTYTMPSGEVDSACLRVYKEDSLNQTLICDTCETSSSATVFCNIAAYGNGRFTAVFYALGSHKLIDWIDAYIGGRFQEDIYTALGNEDASFYAFLFAGIVTVALFVNAVFGIIALMIGLIGASALGFTAIQWSEMMGVIIVGGFIIWIIKR